MPCYAKSTPLGDTRSTENFVCGSGQSAKESGRGVGGKNPSDFSDNGVAHSPPEGYNPELVEGHSPLSFSLVCRHFVFF